MLASEAEMRVVQGREPGSPVQGWSRHRSFSHPRTSPIRPCCTYEIRILQTWSIGGIVFGIARGELRHFFYDALDGPWPVIYCEVPLYWKFSGGGAPWWNLGCNASPLGLTEKYHPPSLHNYIKHSQDFFKLLFLEIRMFIQHLTTTSDYPHDVGSGNEAIWWHK